MSREDRIMAALASDTGLTKATTDVRDYLLKWQEDANAGRPVVEREVAIANAVQMVAPAIANAAIDEAIRRNGAEIMRLIEKAIAKPSP